MSQDAFARASDPAESHAAARKVSSTDLCVLVLNALRDHGPMTTHEIAGVTRVALVSISPRMKPLEKEGAVIRTAERREGRRVWCLPGQVL